MANKNQIKVVAVTRKNARSVHLELQLGNERGSYDVAIVDQNGIFGLELPDGLGLKLRGFPPTESRKLVGSIKRQITKERTATANSPQPV